MKNLTNGMRVFLAILCVTFAQLPAMAQDQEELQRLLSKLADPAAEDWERTEERIIDTWSRSGSTAMDLLLIRGQDALEAEDYQAAIEHFTALTDHAPNFAEGWNMRATAFFLIDEYGLSIEDIGRTLALNPSHFGALSGLGVILEELGDTKNALLAYQSAFKINPHRENLIEAIERLETDVNGREI